MPLKCPAPLNEDEWNNLMKKLNEKADPKYVKMLRDAIENGSKIKEYL